MQCPPRRRGRRFEFEPCTRAEPSPAPPSLRGTGSSAPLASCGRDRLTVACPGRPPGNRTRARPCGVTPRKTPTEEGLANGHKDEGRQAGGSEEGGRNASEERGGERTRPGDKQGEGRRHRSRQCRQAR